MSQKPETKYIARVHRELPPDVYWMKNNNDYTGGIPDVWYSSKTDLWAEYKFVARRPVRAAINPLKLLSPLQADWLKGRYNEGRKVAVIIGCPEGGLVLTDLKWEMPLSAQAFTERLISNKEVANWILEATSA